MAPVSAKINREVRLSLKEYAILFCTSAIGRPVEGILEGIFDGCSEGTL